MLIVGFLITAFVKVVSVCWVVYSRVRCVCKHAVVCAAWFSALGIIAGLLFYKKRPAFLTAGSVYALGLTCPSAGSVVHCF